jgi:peroxiredoxin
MKNILILTVFAAAIWGLSVGATSSYADASTEKEIPDFTLRNVDGRMISTADFPNVKGFAVVFTCNHCPFAKLYTERFNALHQKYTPLGVPLLAVNSMDSLVYEEESFALMQTLAREADFQFPYLQDAAQTVGKAFDAAHTPHAFVVWKEAGKWHIKYSGAIDDNGEEPAKAKPFVANAIDDLLAGRAVREPETESFGCRIFYRK